MNPITGVFATRSSERPNLIGMTLCRILSIHGSTIHIEKIDALDGTPVLDLKPYIPSSDGTGKATVPSWIRGK
jgi:tRNA (Thr-GGU) A37 N-methylase